MRIAILGYNLFYYGGTTQSNINLLNIFSRSNGNNKLFYYNYTFFDNNDVSFLRQKYSFLKQVTFDSFSSLFNISKLNMDIIFVTREDFFPISKLLRFLAPDSLIIGEIHTPLPLLKRMHGLYYFSCVRVATSSIKRKFIKKYGFNRVYVQSVSLNHLKWINDLNTSGRTDNFVIKSRFYEKQKDILYSLRLFNLLKKEHYLNFHLYIEGTGPDKKCYKNYVKIRNLNNQVLFTSHPPKNYIYLSTSNYETYGYSIVEALSKGHKVLAYVGKDNVIYENFKDIPLITWIYKKNINFDMSTLLQCSTKRVTRDMFIDSKEKILKKSSDYISIFLKLAFQFKPFSLVINELSYNDKKKIKEEIEFNLGSMYTGVLQKIYYKIKPYFKNK